VSTAVSVSERDALLVIDVQNDFMPGGALPVGDGDAIVPLINRLAGLFKTVVLTQDWHPAGHASFASSRENAKPFDVADAPYGAQTLWPDHCVQGTPGAALHDGLKIDHAALILRKGSNAEVDSYSAFVEADGRTATGLAPLLKARGIGRTFLCGLATDFCVSWSALDARRHGFEAFVIEDACRAIDADGSLDRALADMNAAGVVRVQSRELIG
jgi:nicotinamidase/pyrazinamidase